MPTTVLSVCIWETEVEFSFVIFALAMQGNLLDSELSKLLVLVVIFSMVVTPFFISRIGDIAAWIYKNVQDVTELHVISKRKDQNISESTPKKKRSTSR